MTVSLEAVLAGNIPPWLARFEKQVGRGMHRASMLKGGERVLIGVSGGKDSLSLALALRLRRKVLPLKLSAALIDWREYPLSAEDRGRLGKYFELLEMPIDFLSAAMIGEEGDRGVQLLSFARGGARRLSSNTWKDKALKRSPWGITSTISPKPSS